MTDHELSPDEEYERYARPENQQPQGPPRRRRAPLSEPIAIRLPSEVLAEIRERATATDRSVSSWIRRAVEHELRHPA